MTHDATPFALVVDDNPTILMDACDILSDAGFRPLEATSVDEAFDQLDQHAGDITLLFTDVELGEGRNGFDLARETAARWPDVKILVASGAREPDQNEMPNGAAFVGKPFSARIVHQRLQEILPEGARPDPLKRRGAKA